MIQMQIFHHSDFAGLNGDGPAAVAGLLTNGFMAKRLSWLSPECGNQGL
jgi:hypothetical protein